MDIAEVFVKKFDRLSNSQISTAIVGLAFVLVVVSFFVWQSSRNMDGAGKIDAQTVGASVFPLDGIVSQVGGQAIETKLIGHGGEDQELVFVFGGGVEDVEGIEGQVVEVAEGMINRELDPELVTNPESSYSARIIPGDDAYYWVSPVNALLVSKRIKDVMVATYPELAEVIEAAQNEYSKQLAKLDMQVRQILLPTAGEEIVTVGATWKHLARDYGFKIRAEFTADDPNLVEKLESVLDEGGVRVVFYDKSAPIGKISAMVESYGATLVELDPFGGGQGRETYEATVLYNANQIASWN